MLYEYHCWNYILFIKMSFKCPSYPSLVPTCVLFIMSPLVSTSKAVQVLFWPFQRVSAMFADASAMLAFLRCVAATELHIRSHSANTDPERGAECIANYVLGYALSTYCIILWINLMCCYVRIDICII